MAFFWGVLWVVFQMRGRLLAVFVGVSYAFFLLVAWGIGVDNGRSGSLYWGLDFLLERNQFWSILNPCARCSHCLLGVLCWVGYRFLRTIVIDDIQEWTTVSFGYA